MEVRSTGCCGVYELVNISKLPNPQAVMDAAVPALMKLGNGGVRGRGLWEQSGPGPYAYFTSVIDRKVGDHASYRKDDYGRALMDFIHEHKLGAVNLATDPKPNWTGNTLCMYMWVIDWQAVIAWNTKLVASAAIPAAAHPAVVLSSGSDAVKAYGNI